MLVQHLCYRIECDCSHSILILAMTRLLEGRAGSVRRYSKRIDDCKRPSSIHVYSTNLNWSWAGAGAIRVRTPRTVATPFSKLLRLDSYSSPGLPEKEFRSLFTKCRSCECIMTHKAFSFHECPGRAEWKRQIVTLHTDPLNCKAM